jgi:hypothetical protein
MAYAKLRATAVIGRDADESPETIIALCDKYSEALDETLRIQDDFIAFLRSSRRAWLINLVLVSALMLLSIVPIFI